MGLKDTYTNVSLTGKISGSRGGENVDGCLLGSWKQYAPLKWSIFNRLHGEISQKTAIFPLINFWATMKEEFHIF
jgi:hypothetical protein